jgi:Uma2 family endonuclease
MAQDEKYLPRYTYNDYVQWEGRWELIEGHPIAMSPLPVPEHQRVSAEILFAFMTALKNSSCTSCKAYNPLDYKIDENTVLQPDVLVVCNKIDKPFLDFPPAIAVEVLSPSTAMRDRNYKYNTYQKQGVKYYLIVEPKTRSIEINSLNEGKYEPEIYSTPYTFELPGGCSILTDFSEVWE